MSLPCPQHPASAPQRAAECLAQPYATVSRAPKRGLLKRLFSPSPRRRYGARYTCDTCGGELRRIDELPARAETGASPATAPQSPEFADSSDKPSAQDTRRGV